jgi:hypothetical protein
VAVVLGGAHVHGVLDAVEDRFALEHGERVLHGLRAG